MEGFRYPKTAEIRKSVVPIVEHLITDTASDLTKDAIQKMAAAMDLIYPAAVIYQTHIEDIEVGHETLLQRLPGYDKIPENLQVKYRKELYKAKEDAVDEVHRMVQLVKQFAININAWKPEHFDKLMQVQDKMVA